MLNKPNLFSLTQVHACYMFLPVARPPSGMQTQEHVQEDKVEIEGASFYFIFPYMFLC